MPRNRECPPKRITERSFRPWGHKGQMVICNQMYGPSIGADATTNSLPDMVVRTGIMRGKRKSAPKNKRLDHRNIGHRVLPGETQHAEVQMLLSLIRKASLLCYTKGPDTLLHGHPAVAVYAAARKNLLVLRPDWAYKVDQIDLGHQRMFAPGTRSRPRK